WEKIATGEDQYTAVFEDDIHLSDSVKELLNDCDWIPDDTDIIKLETNKKLAKLKKHRMEVFKNLFLSRLLGRHLRTGGYIISKNCAGKLLEKTKTVATEVDQLMFNPKHKIMQT